MRILTMDWVTGLIAARFIICTVLYTLHCATSFFISTVPYFTHLIYRELVPFISLQRSVIENYLLHYASKWEPVNESNCIYIRGSNVGNRIRLHREHSVNIHLWVNLYKVLVHCSRQFKQLQINGGGLLLHYQITLKSKMQSNCRNKL